MTQIFISGGITLRGLVQGPIILGALAEVICIKARIRGGFEVDKPLSRIATKTTRRNDLYETFYSLDCLQH